MRNGVFHLLVLLVVILFTRQITAKSRIPENLNIVLENFGGWGHGYRIDIRADRTVAIEDSRLSFTRPLSEVLENFVVSGQQPKIKTKKIQKKKSLSEVSKKKPLSRVSNDHKKEVTKYQ